MLFDSPMLFEQAAQELLPHLTHKIRITPEGGNTAPDAIVVECDDCHHYLVEFVPESQISERPDPTLVRYEGIATADGTFATSKCSSRASRLTLCRSGKTSPTTSPTGIAWSYGGSGPAQCALAILLDNRGDEAQARALYQHFKFRLIAALPTNSEWTLTGTQIEKAIALIASSPQRS